MHIHITVKQLGKKHALLKSQPITLAGIESSSSLKDFLLAVVAQQVAAYNQKREEKKVLLFLTEDNINEQKTTGKIGFGDIYNDNLANLEKAQQRMLEAYTDGLFVVFSDDNQLENLDQNISITTKNEFTFIRLAFLSGSYY